MHKFITTSGKVLWYDMNTNRISLWSPEKDMQAYPVVHFNEPSHIKHDGISLFTIEMTQQCNLRCTYCCYSGEYRDHRAHQSKEISYEVLDQLVDFILKYADKSSEEITVCFYGGEALLAKSKIQYLIEKLDFLYGNRIRYSLSTNGMALTEAVVDWICSHEKFLLNITIDGNEMMHDANRLTVNGKGSYRTIIKNLAKFKEKYPEQYSRRVRFLSTVYSLDNVRLLSEVWDSIDVLTGNLPVHISHIIPNFEDLRRKYDTYEIKDKFYRDAFLDFIGGNDSILSSYFKKLVSIVEQRSFAPLALELEIKTCNQDLFSCFINADGDIYPCEKFCDSYKIGNVFSGFNEKQMKKYVHLFTERKNKFCQSCWAQRFCRMCLTGLNHTDKEIEQMCDMERDTIDLALKYFCDKIDWEQQVDNSK